jgi:hypothetical protein
MRLSSEHFPQGNVHRAHDEEPALCVRVLAEFQEMPGLTLTLGQAVRLFSIDSARCERIFSVLVERGVLSTNGRAFARRDAGRRSI